MVSWYSDGGFSHTWGFEESNKSNFTPASSVPLFLPVSGTTGLLSLVVCFGSLIVEPMGPKGFLRDRGFLMPRSAFPSQAHGTFPSRSQCVEFAVNGKEFRPSNSSRGRGEGLCHLIDSSFGVDFLLKGGGLKLGQSRGGSETKQTSSIALSSDFGTST